jgi:hypothetical protein
VSGEQAWNGVHSLPARVSCLVALGQALTGWLAGASRHWIAVDVVALAKALGVSIWRAAVSRAEASPLAAASSSRAYRGQPSGGRSAENVVSSRPLQLSTPGGDERGAGIGARRPREQACDALGRSLGGGR